MPVFRFKGRKYQGGALVTGEAAVRSKQILAQELRDQGVLPIMIIEKIEERKSFVGAFRQVNSRDLALFAKQFSVMLKAGLPMMRGLEILANQQEKVGFRQILNQIREDLESGFSLADALRRHPRTFSPLFTDMVAAGEVGGFLDLAFERLANYGLRAFRLRNLVVSASLYPLVVVIAALAAISVMLVWVVPVFASLFRGLEAPLPFFTRLVISCSELIGKFGLPSFCLIAVTPVLIRSFYRRPEWQLAIDRRSLQIPIVGKLLQKIWIARFSLTLATLLSSGIPLLEGLQITASTAGNSFFRDSLIKLRTGVAGGKTVFTAMEDLEIFPPLVTGMVAVGEQAGNLDNMLEHLAQFYEEESETGLKRAMTLLEPLLVLLLGVVVGGIVIALYLPVFSLVGHLSR